MKDLTPELKDNNDLSRLVSFSRGKQIVTIGDVFQWYNKKRYEVLSFNDGCLSYSPSGLGGTVAISIKDLETGEIEEWCADSVASGVFTTINYPTQTEITD